ncbi:bifunctional 3-dehydroquinate dehydratase/shikimate dehydrogenase, chloroplastic-like [Quercus suber]|uniref:bifunctional 3-dehydroquinate dehydratase/shikimate dehydrogenase, chloroplastic-like n=1 Tax=Quercus suber TaxID=58331 RepID=UPI0032DE9084
MEFRFPCWSMISRNSLEPIQALTSQVFFPLFDETCSVGIPHKEAAVRCSDEVHPLAKSIGAVNTIVRRPIDGKLIGYNTDCEASITAIEDALRERRVANGEALRTSPIAGKTFALVGAGGAGRALAFGAKSRGAQAVIFNRIMREQRCLQMQFQGKLYHMNA